MYVTLMLYNPIVNRIIHVYAMGESLEVTI